MASGVNPLNLEIAEQPFLISSKDKKLLEAIKKGFCGFISTPEKTPIRINVIVRKDLSENPYSMGNPHQINIYQVDDYITANGSTFTGWLRPNEKEAEVSLSRNIAPFYLFLRFVTIITLAEKDGFIIHASSIVHKNSGYIFAGRPNSGKSTITRLSSSKKVLCDDFSIIKKVNGKFKVFPSPFWGSIKPGGKNEHRPYPIKGIYLLRQSDENYARPLKTWQKKFFSLHQNVLMFPRLQEHCENIFRLENELIKRVGLFELYFTINEPIWRYLEK